MTINLLCPPPPTVQNGKYKKTIHQKSLSQSQMHIKSISINASDFNEGVLRRLEKTYLKQSYIPEHFYSKAAATVSITLVIEYSIDFSID